MQQLSRARRLRHVPLVSRRFRDASRDPAAWPELTVSHAAFPTRARWMSFLRWLATMGSGLHSLHFFNQVESYVRALYALLFISFTYMAHPCSE